jgi:acyl dehydratase
MYQEPAPPMSSYEVVAQNFSTEHENKIHSDEIAQKYGFKGALVPGVAVFGHLTHPLVERFGEDWLTHSVNHTRFFKPAYHGDRLVISLEESDDGFLVQGHNEEGELLADIRSTLPAELPEPEDDLVFNAPARQSERVEMSWDSITEGEPFPEWHFQTITDENQRYAEQISDELPIYRHVTHPHWLLSVANQALTREYIMPAWIHVGSEIRFRELVRVGDTLAVNAVPVEKWERKGHQFIRLYITYKRLDVLTTEMFHTAIFRVAE